MMQDRIRQQWESLGTDDPYWAVLTSPEKQHGGWDKEEFFQTGAEEINRILSKAATLGVNPGFELALDYGCGVGRLSRALATRFQRVLGVDISDAMLIEARSANARFDNIQFVRNNGNALPGVTDRSVDFIYSNIVLQHSPRQIQQSLIKEFCRVLRPGGVLAFQTPSSPNLMTIKGVLYFLLGNRILNVVKAIKNGKTRVMEMHAFPKNDVLATLKDEGLVPLKVERYDSAGEEFIGYIYFVTRC
jgi:ubiquinone/menaquinone biosynthesis C-methylase UbiE